MFLSGVLLHPLGLEPSGCAISFEVMPKSKYERRKERASLGKLRDRLLSPRTLTNYKSSTRLFLHYCSIQGFPSSTTPATVDIRLCEYIEHCWEEGETRNLPANARSGLMHFIPSLRGALPGSQRLLAAWSKNELPNRAAPLPIKFLMALVGCAIRGNDLRMATTLLVAFHALLRTGELLQVQASHFVLPRHDGPILLTLPNTKSGQRLQSTPETVVITDPLVKTYVTVMVGRLQPGDRLYPHNGNTFRREFSHLVRTARLPEGRWQAYSLRRGGATAHFCNSEH